MYKRTLGLLAMSGALAVAGAACSSSTSSSSSTNPGATGATGASTTGQSTATNQSDMVTAIPSLSGIGTSVKLDPGTAAALQSLHVAIAPAGSAKFDAATSTITFPITSGYAEIHSDARHRPGTIEGSINHVGSGFTLTAGGTQVVLDDFVVDPGNSMLYGTVGTMIKVPLLFLDGTNVKVSMDPQGDVVLDGTVAKLTDTAAGALNAAFKVTALKAGMPLGTVHLVAKGTPVTYDATKDKTAEISRLSGQSTSVKLDPGTAGALQQLGVMVAPEGSAKFDSATSTVSFPITGGFAAIHSDMAFKPGYIVGNVIHEGSGLTFTKGAKSLTVKDFVVDPGSSTLTATAGTTPGVNLLFLDGSNVKVSMDGSNVVLDGTVAKLTSAAASALNSTFGVTAFKEGLPLGTVHLVAAGS